MNLDDFDIDVYPGDVGKLSDLDDGRAIRLRVEYDESASINDYDSDGKVSDAYDYRHGRDERPSGFDGNAEKIEVDRGAFVWWQPPEGFPRSDERFAGYRAHIRDLLEYGFMGMILEVCSGEDAYGRPIVVDTASLWAVEGDASGEYRREIVSDLLAGTRCDVTGGEADHATRPTVTLEWAMRADVDAVLTDLRATVDPFEKRAELVAILLLRGWSRTRIAEAVGVTRQTVYNWEKEGKS